DSITKMTFYDRFQQTQAKHIPYYLIAIITTRQSSDFEILDGVAFYYDSNDLDKPPLDGLKSIYYFAINCFAYKNEYLFKPIQKEFFEPIDLSKTSQKFMPFPLYYYYPRKVNFKYALLIKMKFLELDELLIGGLDHNAPNLNLQHTYIAEKIENMEIFSGLEKNTRSIEVFKWFWCSLCGNNLAIGAEDLIENRDIQKRNLISSKL
ncbi:MAG: hypothetical protein Q8K60_04725, partial [Parachlamydiaceae bacterium]|nr:hypothetical protein [Parachlamydiaceae bacterium]